LQIWLILPFITILLSNNDRIFINTGGLRATGGEEAVEHIPSLTTNYILNYFIKIIIVARRQRIGAQAFLVTFVAGQK
jgi:hypothetical protein